MKRSNRLVLLVGVFLAIVAFVAVIVLAGNGGGTGGPRHRPPPTTGTRRRSRRQTSRCRAASAPTRSRSRTLDLTSILPGAFSDPSQVIGRDRAPAGQDRRPRSRPTTLGAVSGTVVDVQVPAGLRAIAVRVDQTSGVGTVIKSGDYVDSIIALNEETVRLGRPGRLSRRPSPSRTRVPRDDGQADPPGHAGARHAAPARRGTVRRGHPAAPSAAPRHGPATPSSRSS